MHRALLSLLIFTLLSTSIVWATDAHEDLLPEHAISAPGCLYDTPVDDGDLHQSHGCHMSSHLVAMTMDSDVMRTLGHDSYFPSAFQTLHSRPSAPPIKPPRS